MDFAFLRALVRRLPWRRHAVSLHTTGFTDEASGLPNRAHAELHLEIEFGAANRGRPVAVVLFDMNGLEGFTAKKGTIVGDAIVRTIGDVLKQTTRRMNMSARIGDGLFLCILGGCDDEGAIIFVNRLQEGLAGALGDRALPALNGGIASFRASMRSPHDLIAAAESALKQARKDGPGRIRIYGHPGSLPVATDSPSTAKDERQPVTIMPQGRGHGRKALIVAEDASIRGLLARLMADYGFTVAQVSNVVDGVQCLSVEFDLLLTDISLTEGLGGELVRAAKLRWPSIQVLGIVHPDEGALLIEALNAGVDRYLVTPLDLAKVRHHISELLARRDRVTASILESRQLTLEFKARTDDAVAALRRNEEASRLLEQQLQQSQKVEAIGRLVGGLAHDFNNLLTIVRGNAQLLKEEGIPEGTRELVDEIDHAAQRGVTLVRQLLAFGRKKVTHPSLLNLNMVVDQTRSLIDRLIGENIILDYELDPALGMIRADAGQLEQVLLNLAVNAREAMRGGGHLRIATRNGVMAAHGSGEVDDRFVVLTVSDDGIGMDRETRQHIFEPFFTTKNVTHASGLGLATVYGIVKQSGGTISVSSEPGLGTTFEIALPRVDA